MQLSTNCFGADLSNDVGRQFRVEAVSRTHGELDARNWLRVVLLRRHYDAGLKDKSHPGQMRLDVETRSPHLGQRRPVFVIAGDVAAAAEDCESWSPKRSSTDVSEMGSRAGAATTSTARHFGHATLRPTCLSLAFNLWPFGQYTLNVIDASPLFSLFSLLFYPIRHNSNGRQKKLERNLQTDPVLQGA